jgi:outer membrane protein assembly factor BamB
VQIKSYTGISYTLGYDLVVVATRNVGTGSTTNNKIYGLNGNTGATVWTAATGNLDIVNATPAIDYTNNVVWVTSRSNGNAQASVWKINSLTGALLSSFKLNDIDQAPTLNTDGLVVYVLANSGTVTAIRTDLANCTTSFTSALSTTPVGFPLPYPTAAKNEDVYFSASNSVRKMHFAYGATCTGTFTESPGGWTNPAITAPSALIYTLPPLSLFLYVGSSDGHLYKINPTTGANTANRLINTGATIGDPSFDNVLQTFYVGDSTGHIFSFSSF